MATTPCPRWKCRNQIDSSHPFVIRWGWYAGGGHFIDGRGIEGNYIYYMDPWPGEGYKIALYSWVVDDGIHQWTHSLELTTIKRRKIMPWLLLLLGD